MHPPTSTKTAPPDTAPDPNKTEPLNRRIGFFDSDCLELADAAPVRRSRELPAFAIRERMYPMAEKLERLYAFAKTHQLTTVFTQCCSARIVRPGSPETPPDILVVPMETADRSWERAAGDYRLINLAKHNNAPLHESFICRHFDAFQHNANARALFAALAIPQWIVFGHGFDLCVDSAIKGLIAAGYKVHLLTDVMASSATGYGPYGTEDSKRSILDYLLKIGVTSGTSEAFFERGTAW